jgi:hypothetical protein
MSLTGNVSVQWIGRHMEKFKSIDGVPEEKSSGLFRGIRLESNRKIPRKRHLVTLSVMLVLKPIEQKKFWKYRTRHFTHI